MSYNNNGSKLPQTYKPLERPTANFNRQPPPRIVPHYQPSQHHAQPTNVRNVDTNTARVSTSTTSANSQVQPMSVHSPFSSTGLNQDSLWGSRNVSSFQKITQVGEGTYGKVYKARDKETGEYVALKRVRMDNEKEGFPITAIREIKILKTLNHENVVKLKEIVTADGDEGEDDDDRADGGGIYMVFEFMDHDLTGLLESNQYGGGFPLAQIKCYMLQLLEGLFYCHRNNVLHRDLKGSNLLINNRGQLKLADFGLARPFNQQLGRYTNKVITLWYRPPELLLGEVQYGPAVDLWSAGCILAELLLRKALLPGRNEIDQLELIYRLCGTPTSESWPGIEQLPWAKIRPKGQHASRLRETFKNFTPDVIDIVERLLQMCPQKRAKAKEALDMDFFWTAPLPNKPGELPSYNSSHEFTTKKRKQHSGASGVPGRRARRD